MKRANNLFPKLVSEENLRLAIFAVNVTHRFHPHHRPNRTVARVEAAEIDATDILSARIRAMALAIEALTLRPDYVLIDGNRDHGRCASIDLPHETVVGGDGRSVSIAAASILAKVTRDRYVTQVLDREYPQYLFAQHKGYGTKLHYAMLDQYGPCPEHRQSFLKKWKERQS